MIIFAQQRNSSIRHWVFAVFLFACVVVVGTPHIAKAETPISTAEPLYESHTWNIAGSPYIISGDGFLDIQGDLTIEPGVTVRFSGNQSVLIRGPFTAVGTPEAPIVFTAGEGDTCGQNSWGGFFMNSPYDPSVIRYAEFRCGSVFTGDLGHYEFTQIDFETMGVTWIPQIVTTEALIHIEQGDVTVEHTTFSELTSTAVLHNVSSNAAMAQHNWWGDASGPSVSTNPTGTGYSIIGDSVIYEPWSGQVNTEVPTSTPSRNPVIFIPGILGTEFVRRTPFLTDQLVWLDIAGLILSPSDRFILNLSFNSDGTPVDPTVHPANVISLKINPINGDELFNYTENFLNTLEQSRYQNDQNVFLFAYDWRMSNSSTSALLAERIEEILNHTTSTKVDIIAHSMGGLVVKEYIRRHGENSRIGKLIFLGTPHLGSPDAIQNLLFGGDLNIKVRNHSFLNPGIVKELGRNMPTIYELLPSESYVNLLGPVLSSIVERRNYTYTETRDFLRNSDLNNNLIDLGANFHSEIDEMIIPQTIEAYSIQGCGLPTTRRLVKQSPKFGEDEWLLHIGDGDGTVPLGSAEYVHIPDNHKITIPHLAHSEMPSNNLAQPIILDILSGNTSSLNHYSHTEECGVNGTLVSVHSPVALSVTNSAGQFVGVSTTGDIEYSIPGSRYDQLGENKFIFLPSSLNGENYQVDLQGTATGTFNVRVTSIVNNTPEETNLFLDLGVTNQSNGSLIISPQSVHAPNLIFDKEGDGTFITLQPDAETNAVDAEDVVAPTTTISIQGQMGQNQWYVSTTTISLSAQDTESGVLRIMYSLDSGLSWAVYSQPITLFTDGRYTIQYYGIDNTGNREGVKETSILIDRTPPEAEFYFNSQIKDVTVIGRDAISTTTVSTTPNSYTVKDQAGNTLQLVFDEINRPILKRASLNRLVYNGRVVLPNARLTSFVWLTNARNEISSLQQALRYNVDDGLYALYTKLGGRTFIRERINWNTFQDRYENEMKVFRFTTNLGNILYR